MRLSQRELAGKQSISYTSTNSDVGEIIAKRDVLARGLCQVKWGYIEIGAVIGLDEAAIIAEKIALSGVGTTKEMFQIYLQHSKG